MNRIALLTGGGDAPGMNACIRAVVRTALARGLEVIGVRNAFDGLIDGYYVPLSFDSVDGILARGGTILNCGRSKRFRTEPGQDEAVRRLREADVDGLIIIGGDGSLTAGTKLEARGIRVVGIPATIDNDVSHTDMAIGVDTALNTCVEAIDRIHDTASAHHRAFIVEVMGRRSGYLALAAGLAAGADMILIPEVETAMSEVIEAINRAYGAGQEHFIIVVAEGFHLGARGVHEGINSAPNPYESRLTILGHVVRGGTPSAYDRVLGARMGSEAVHLLSSGISNVMVGRRGTDFVATPLPEVVADRRRLRVSVRDLALELVRPPAAAPTWA